MTEEERGGPAPHSATESRGVLAKDFVARNCTLVHCMTVAMNAWAYWSGWNPSVQETRKNSVSEVRVYQRVMDANSKLAQASLVGHLHAGS